jgi:hypothetical protein
VEMAGSVREEPEAEDQQGLGKGQDVKEEKLGRSRQEGAKSDSTSSPARSPRLVCTKTDA